MGPAQGYGSRSSGEDGSRVGGPHSTAGRLLWSAGQAEGQELNGDIARQTTARGVLQLHAAAVRRWSLLNVVTALHRIAKAPDGQAACANRGGDGGAGISELIGRLAAEVDDCKAQQLANTAWAFSRLSYLDRPLLAAIARCSISKMSAFKT